MNDSYSIPDLLRRIIEWERRMVPEVPYLEKPTGLFLGFSENENGGYACSPADSILFANTGMDGVHYSLLTDFGKAADLGQAPVIRVAPMDFGNCVNLVAGNLSDFFSLLFYGHEGLLFNEFRTEQEYARYRVGEEEDQTTACFDHRKWREQKKRVSEAAIDQFQFVPIEHPFRYIQTLRAERTKSIVLPTKDGLGILPRSEEGMGKTYPTHPWSGMEIPWNAPDEIEDFIARADVVPFLAFVRDFQAEFNTDTEALRMICRRLETIGLHQDAVRLLHCM
ncbi:hypothetical protein J25TS5_35800 [Paenibacillus faecis]|uniref:hypothetical protein n=1 Tax=Paenibacillus faecis TaxID=862114 RepID=UPI001B23549D|nr:hypothetical protein [Paenibacillus faecis]GIO86648.1 hypothetical protein J25TS5_35800 [Paenibacillus faecis]